jgi:hypothetical protein
MTATRTEHEIFEAYTVPDCDSLVMWCPRCKGWRTAGRGGRGADAPDFGVLWAHRRSWLLVNRGPATDEILRAASRN